MSGASNRDLAGRIRAAFGAVSTGMQDHGTAVSRRVDRDLPLSDVEISLLLEGTTLGHGAHRLREDGMCAMELVAYVAGENHGYAPQCASQVLTGFTIRLNDAMRDDERQALKPFLPRLIGTRAGDEARRFETMAALAVTRLLLPALERRGQTRLVAEWPAHALDKWLHDAGSTSGLPRGLRRSLRNAAAAAGPAGEGLVNRWQRGGGELGLAVTDARRLAGERDWSSAFEILEAGIDAGAAPEGTPVVTPARASAAAP